MPAPKGEFRGPYFTFTKRRLKIVNNTDLPGEVLRKMFWWCFFEVGLPQGWLLQAEFSWLKHGCYSGAAWCYKRRMRVSIGPDNQFPNNHAFYPGTRYPQPIYSDRIEALVGVTVHELEHHYSYLFRRGGKRKQSERYTCIAESRATEKFRQQRDELLAKWHYPIPEKKRVVSAS